jgi:hypothetical protein
MGHSGLAMALLLAAAAPALAEAARPPTVVPPPQEITLTGERTAGLTSVTVLTEPGAHPAVGLAADALRTALARRCGVKAEMVAGDIGDAEGRLVFVLGEAGEGRLVNRVCERAGVKLSFEGVGSDSYLVEMPKDGGRQLVVVAGSNPRAVFYGQDTVSQLIAAGAKPGQATIWIARIRDWASIPWRAAHSPGYQRFRGVADDAPDPASAWLEGCLRARLNVVALHQAGPGMRWRELTEDDYHWLKRSTDEAHRRGLLVYATFLLPTDPAEFAGLTASVERVIGFGVDGLWLSYNDPISNPELGDVLIPPIKLMVDLGAKHGITGDRIAYTPPLQSAIGTYVWPGPDHKRLLDAVPAMKDAVYFITQPPSADTHQQAVEVGLDRYSWWHNWPRGWRYSAGSRPVADSLAPIIETPAGQTGKRGPDGGYNGWVSLTEGWHRPRPTAPGMRQAEAYIRGVNFWGGSDQCEYVLCTGGQWAWNPAQFDEYKTRMAIYRMVFGPSAALAAANYDDALMRAKMGFLESKAKGKGRIWVRRPGQAIRDDAGEAADLKQMRVALERIERTASEETLLPVARLDDHYLTPMAGEVAALEAFLHDDARQGPTEAGPR